MANLKALTMQGGFHTIIPDADTVDIGSGIDVNTPGPINIGTVKATVQQIGHGNSGLTLNSTTGAVDMVAGVPGIQFTGNGLIVNIGGGNVIQLLGSTLIGTAIDTLGFFGGGGGSKQTITGNLNAVADVNVKAILTSLLGALATSHSLVNDGTT